MLDSLFLLVYFCLIVVLQSTIGVGVLVLGTPLLLILNYNIIEVFFILLPISIITSLSNLLIINFFYKRYEKSTFTEFKKFFIICVPSIIIGLVLLKLFQNLINFKILVSIVIIFSILMVIFKEKIKFKINFFRKSILLVVGIVHGLTNSGGTLMSLALSSNKSKSYARLNITFFYFILASIQYLLAIIIFYNEFSYPKNTNLIWVIMLGVIIGNLINSYINEDNYRKVINILAILSSLILIFDY